MSAAAGRARSARCALAVAAAVVVVGPAAGSARAATVVSTVPAGQHPRALAVDEASGRVFVTHQVAGAGTSVHDAAGSQIGSIAAGTFGAAVDATRGRLYLTESTDRSLRAYDLSTLSQTLFSQVGPFAYVVAVDPGLNRVFVVSQSSDGIYVVDGSTGAVITNIPIAGWPPYGVAVNPATHRVYASGINNDTVSVIDGSTNAVVASVNVGDQPNAIAVNPETNLVYVANQGGNSVSVIDGATNLVVATIPVGAEPQGIAVNPAANRVYVTNGGAAALSIVDGQTNAVVETIGVGAVPIGVAVNTQTSRVYVANLHGHSLSIVDDTPGPPPGFVTREGTSLQLDGQPYRPVGLNIYNANSNGWCWYAMDGSILGDSLSAIGPGKNAMRAWFFQQLATTNGQRDWTAFDRTLATARAHGYKVVATLVDQWGDCGVSTIAGYGFKDKAWYEEAYQQADPSVPVSYREWVAEVVARYKDDPTILAWQLVNEPEVNLEPFGDCGLVPESTATALLRAFAADVSGLIKAIDPHHLVSLGTIGSGQCGAQGDDYEAVMSVPTLDLCEFHDYDNPGQLVPGDQWNGLQRRIDQCNALHKPLLVGELGHRPSDVGGTLAARAEVVDAKLCAQLSAGVAGLLVWAWSKDGSTIDNYDIGPGDPVLAALAPWSNPAHVCTAPSSPSDVVAGAGDGVAAVGWLPPASDGASVIRSYTVTAAPGGQSITVPASRSSTLISGLANGTAYTFTVSATNAAGSSAPSASSAPVTPTAGAPLPAAAVESARSSASTTVSTGSDPAQSGGITTSVTVPAGTAGGTVSVVQSGATGPSPAGAGWQINSVQTTIEAPAATAADPLTLVFTVAAQPGQTPDAIQVYRTEVSGTPTLIVDCDAETTDPGSAIYRHAQPDACIWQRRAVQIGGIEYLELTVLSSSASRWNKAAPLPAAVAVGDRAFAPKAVTVQLGGLVTWSWTGSKSHTVTDAAGLGAAGAPWFDSGARTNGAFGFAFPAGGSFTYASQTKGDPSGFGGVVHVPVLISRTGTSAYTVLWSSKRLAGYVHDVRYRFKPAGSSRWSGWTTWQDGAATTSSTFTPTRGAGTYALQARLRNEATNRASGYSPESTFAVS